MRCDCCNVNLSDYESVLKHPETGQYLDTCLVCLEDTGITPIAPSNIPPQHGWDDEVEYTTEDDDEDAGSQE